MKTSELRAKSEAELKEEILKFRKKLFNIRFQKANGQTEGIGQIASTRKTIARIKTLLTEKKKNI